MIHNLVDDLIDFDFEKRRLDPHNRQTWVYNARFRGYVFQEVQGPKGIVSVGGGA